MSIETDLQMMREIPISRKNRPASAREVLLAKRKVKIRRLCEEKREAAAIAAEMRGTSRSAGPDGLIRDEALSQLAGGLRGE